MTTSLCLPGAAVDFRVAVVDVAPQLLLMATDGYGASFADEDWRATVGADLVATVAAHGVAAVAGVLPEWLAESAATGGDDVSVALVCRATPA